MFYSVLLLYDCPTQDENCASINLDSVLNYCFIVKLDTVGADIDNTAYFFN
jgi:hypothetical protein